MNVKKAVVITYVRITVSHHKIREGYPMKLGYLDDEKKNENRITLIPDHAKQLAEKGLNISLEKGFEKDLYINKDYTEKTLKFDTKKAILDHADCVVKLHKPTITDLKKLKKGCLLICFLDPFNEADYIKEAQKANITLISLEMIPRITRAQKMDVLSSQASLAGYAAVIVAAEKLNKILPMMMTPAGTLAPSKIFIIGAGVAGLQAIATAKRLGARVEAFDTRPVVEEQVQSLGAKFVKVDLGEMSQTKDGYAKPLTAAQLKKQQTVMAKHIAASDIVITTAQVFGRKAPKIVTAAMVKGMKKGSVIVDLAVESGGNVAGSKVDQEVDVNGVTIVGIANMPGQVPMYASQMLSANITHLINECWDEDSKKFNIDLENDILKGCVITHQGDVVNERIK